VSIPEGLAIPTLIRAASPRWTAYCWEKGRVSTFHGQESNPDGSSFRYARLDTRLFCANAASYLANCNAAETSRAERDKRSPNRASSPDFGPSPFIRHAGRSVALGAGSIRALVKDYATVGAYILFRGPEDIRILGQEPMIGVTLFDMVSNGPEFRVSIPRKKLFVIGSNDGPATSQNKLENLRPDALLTSLVVFPPDPMTDFTVLENDTERALYVL
jgi:hypothetical protein